MVEQLAEWLAKSEALAEIRSRARSDFFGYDEPGTVKYRPGAEDINPRERRFLGWFGFGFWLPAGKHPAELAASALWSGEVLTSAVESIQRARYVMAVVTMVGPGKRVCLELEDEEFEVESRLLSQVLRKDDNRSQGWGEGWTRQASRRMEGAGMGLYAGQRLHQVQPRPGQTGRGKGLAGRLE